MRANLFDSVNNKMFLSTAFFILTRLVVGFEKSSINTITFLPARML